MRMQGRLKVNNTRSITEAMQKAASDGVREVAEDCLTEANDGPFRVPVDDGDLRRSGEVVHDAENLRAAITYDTPYAIRQHEDPTLNHPRGGEDHWLEKTLEANADRYFQYLADKVRAAVEQ